MQEAKPVVIVEWRFGGHRLGYVRALVCAAAEMGCGVTLITSSAAVGSKEYAVHLADLASAGLFNCRIVERLEKPRILLRVLRQNKLSGNPTVIPEGDTLLPMIVTMALLRQLPRRTATIMMRPPNLGAPGVRSRFWPLTKLALLIALTRLPLGVRVFLLEDPLASSAHRVWKPPLDEDRLRLDDPCDMMGSAGDLPDGLGSSFETDDVLAVIGSIDPRKKLPLIASAWRMRTTKAAQLVVAGKPTPTVADWLSSSDLTDDPSVTVISEYLENPQLMAIINRSKGIISLQDGAASSGVTIVAAAVGKRLIGLRNTRSGEVAAANGIAELCTADPRDLARAMDAVLQSTTPPEKVNLPSSLEFGKRIITAVLSTL